LGCNKNLLPEKSISFDAGVYYDLNFVAGTRFEVSYFNINTKDKCVDPDAEDLETY
jgi:outer membrane receptor for ferrienterochelin and colicin